MKYIKMLYLKEIIHDGLYSAIYNHVFGDDFDYSFDVELVKKFKKGTENSWYDEATNINIDVAIKALEKLKEEGANFVQIFNHTDHDGYNFIGLHVEEPTSDEIKKHEETKKKNAEKTKEQEIKELEKRLKKLKDES